MDEKQYQVNLLSLFTQGYIGFDKEGDKIYLTDKGEERAQVIKANLSPEDLMVLSLSLSNYLYKHKITPEEYIDE